MLNVKMFGHLVASFVVWVVSVGCAFFSPKDLATFFLHVATSPNQKRKKSPASSPLKQGAKILSHVKI